MDTSWCGTLIPPMRTMEMGISGCVSKRHLEKLRQTGGKYKVMHKLRGIRLLLNERMYIKMALDCYRLINLGRYQV